MYKAIFAAFCILVPFLLNAQNGITVVLNKIERNNMQIKAFKSFMKSTKLELESGNNLPDPQAGAYYMPWGKHNTDDYFEFQITQSMEFPLVYSERSKLTEKRMEVLEYEFASLRQQTLLNAKKKLLELIYLNKLLIIEKERIDRENKVFEQKKTSYENEKAGILKVHKAKISLMQAEFKLEELKNRRDNLLVELQNLNGGEEIEFELNQFPGGLELSPIDSMLQEKQKNDPEITVLEHEQKLAKQQVGLAKALSYPDLTAGFNYQGVPSSSYYGIYGGISIPLWSNRRKTDAAQAGLELSNVRSSARTLEIFSDFRQQYNDYQMLLKKYNEFKNTLTELKSDTLLYEAYELGKISFIEYYMELQFYREAYNSMLEVEFQLNKAKAEILKHYL